MPLYDFQCTKCEHVFEENTKSDATPPVCPECGGSTEKVISVPNFKVKQISDKALWHHKKAVADFKEQSSKKMVFPMAGKPQKKKSP